MAFRAGEREVDPNRVLASLPRARWRLAGNHSVRGRVTLLDLLETYTSHIHQHIQQIERNCEAFRQKSRVRIQA
jgi:hypothetical protein